MAKKAKGNGRMIANEKRLHGNWNEHGRVHSFGKKVKVVVKNAQEKNKTLLDLLRVQSILGLRGGESNGVN